MLLKCALKNKERIKTYCFSIQKLNHVVGCQIRLPAKSACFDISEKEMSRFKKELTSVLLIFINIDSC